MKSFSIKNSLLLSLLSMSVFVAIYVYYFWLAYNVPFLADDFLFNAISNQDLKRMLQSNSRIGTIVYVLMHRFDIPYYGLMPFLHLANLFLGYYLIKGVKLNIFNLDHIKEFLVFFIFYTFLNSAPFEGIVWYAGTISNNFGLLFVLLFFIYIKKLVANSTLSITLHMLYLLISYLAGWAIEGVPAYILASAIFLCLYLHVNDIKSIDYLCTKKSIVLAYILTACGWFSQATATNFWVMRLRYHENDTWNFYESIKPIPAIIKILIFVVLILLLYYFMNRKKLSDKSQKTVTYIFLLTILSFLTCLINFRVFYPRVFLYNSFIAGGILFYIYLNFIASNKNYFINRVVFYYLMFIGLNCAYLLSYNTLLEKNRSKHIFSMIEENLTKSILNLPDTRSILNLPDTRSIPSGLFFRDYALKLRNLAKNNLSILYNLSNNYPLYEWYQSQFNYSHGYFKAHYYPNIRRINTISYEDFIDQNR